MDAPTAEEFMLPNSFELLTHYTRTVFDAFCRAFLNAVTAEDALARIELRDAFFLIPGDSPAFAGPEAPHAVGAAELASLAAREITEREIQTLVGDFGVAGDKL